MSGLEQFGYREQLRRVLTTSDLVIYGLIFMVPMILLYFIGVLVSYVVVKRKLVEVLNVWLEPIRKRRTEFEQRPDDVLDILLQGARRAKEIAEETLALAKKAMRQDYFPRTLTLK